MLSKSTQLCCNNAATNNRNKRLQVPAHVLGVCGPSHCNNAASCLYNTVLLYTPVVGRHESQVADDGECSDALGTRQPPFSVFVGNEAASTPNSYTMLDNTNCSAYPVEFTASSQALAVPCSRQGRFVVIKATGGPLVLCEVQVYGEWFERWHCICCV